jgi:ribosome-binding protein aMBF1 (putative translation factor)
VAFRGPHTAEARRKVSEAQKGHAVSAETRAKLSEAMMGKLNSAKWGKCRRVDDHELDWHIREIGRLVRDARLERDVSQEELAAASGLGIASICRIEQGKTRRNRNLGGTVSTIVRIALALGVRPYELMP